MGCFELWDVLSCGTFSDGTFNDGTFCEWDVSRAGPFVCAPSNDFHALSTRVKVFNCIQFLSGQNSYRFIA